MPGVGSLWQRLPGPRNPNGAPPTSFEGRDSAPYLFLGQTTSLCETCLDLVPAKIIAEGERVFYLKRCRAHGVQKTLVADDLGYWKAQRDWLKPGDRPLATQTRTEHGCPYDCGLCPDHEQHSCLAIIEDQRGLQPDLPGRASPKARSSAPRTRPLAEIERMLDTLVASEGEPDLVQFSGGEPTIHPQFFDILAAAKRRPIRHLMINTNGIRIAREPGLRGRTAGRLHAAVRGLSAVRLARSAPPCMDLRGADLSRIRIEALEALEKAGLSTTLVVTVKKGVNDAEIPDIVRFALQWRCVRGVTFQPIQDGGTQRWVRPQAAPDRADGDSSPHRRSRCLRAGGPDPVALQPGPDLHRLRAAGPRQGHPGHRAAAARAVRRRCAQHA